MLKTAILVISPLKTLALNKYVISLINYIKNLVTTYFQARQFILGDDMGGPLECLQYFTSLTGTVSR